jgi:folate-binding Fe-S cluster repair protein YgfZ
MTMATEKIMIGIDDQVIELKGADKEAFLADQETRQAESLILETEYKAKQDARASALTKLGEIAGLTKEELDAIL